MHEIKNALAKIMNQREIEIAHTYTFFIVHAYRLSMHIYHFFIHVLTIIHLYFHFSIFTT